MNSDDKFWLGLWIVIMTGIVASSYVEDQTKIAEMKIQLERDKLHISKDNNLSKD
jgi:hypothetical protein